MVSPLWFTGCCVQGVDPHSFTASMFEGVELAQFMSWKDSADGELRTKFTTLRQRAKVFHAVVYSPSSTGANPTPLLGHQLRYTWRVVSWRAAGVCQNGLQRGAQLPRYSPVSFFVSFYGPIGAHGARGVRAACRGGVFQEAADQGGLPRAAQVSAGARVRCGGA